MALLTTHRHSTLVSAWSRKPSGRSRLTPAKLAYGGAEGAEEEARAFDSSLAAGVTLFDTAAMYSNGASERRLGKLAHGTAALIAASPRPTACWTPAAS